MNKVYEKISLTQSKYSCIFYTVFESVMYNFMATYLHKGNKYKERNENYSVSGALQVSKYASLPSWSSRTCQDFQTNAKWY